MQKDSTSKTSKRKDSKARDPLAPYHKQAETFLRLYFGKETPAYVRDLLASWLTELEDDTQMLFNNREILTVAVPLMLREADRMGIDVDSAGSPFNLANPVCRF